MVAVSEPKRIGMWSEPLGRDLDVYSTGLVIFGGALFGFWSRYIGHLASGADTQDIGTTQSGTATPPGTHREAA